MKTSNMIAANEETSPLSSITKAMSNPLVTKAKYPFPHSAGIFGIAAKRYKPAKPENVVETTNDLAINLAY